MGTLTVLALRIVLATAFAGSLVAQAVIVPLVAVNLDEFAPGLVDVRGPLVVIAILGVAAVQATMVAVWRLLTMARRGTVFSHAAFRYVDVVIGAVAAACVLTLALAVALAPGEAVAPGIVLLICGAAVMVAGMALIVLVMRQLLAQAVARDAEAHHLRAELDEVI
jgi:hypothetical protein